MGQINLLLAFWGDDFHFLGMAVGKIQTHVFVHKAFFQVFLAAVFSVVTFFVALKNFAVIDFACAEIGID